MTHSKLILAADGIFPVTLDSEGHPLPQLPASGFDFPGTIQGEGKLNGIPSLFIRLAGCNLHCIWKAADGSISECDTAYASYRVRQTLTLSIEEIYRIVRHNTNAIHHIVITGGEPFLQASPLKELCMRLKQEKDYHLTLETNATLYEEELVRQIDFFSLSPKLSASVPEPPHSALHEAQRLQPALIQKIIDHCRLNNKDFQLKFVCSGQRDIEEIKELLSGLKNWKNEDILLMPLGANQAELQNNIRQVLTFCIRNGWRYCDRLHLTLFGNRSGV